MRDATTDAKRNLDTMRKEEAMAKLRESYKAVYDDSYRASGVGFFQRYIEKFYTLSHDFYYAVDSIFPDYRCSFFNHELNSELWRGKYTERESEQKRIMVLLEQYLMQIHHFIDTEKFDRYRIYNCKDGRWWNYTYSEKERCFSIADEDLDDVNKAWKIMEQWKTETEEEHKKWGPCWTSMRRRLEEREKSLNLS